MNIDVLHFTSAQWDALNYEQRKIVYDAQKEKNKRERKLETDKESAKLMLIANGTARSTLLDAMVNELIVSYDEEMRDLADVTYDAVMNAVSSTGSGGGVTEEVTEFAYNPSSPDESLSPIDRFRAVKEYYMAMEDPVLRYNAFLSDSAVKAYLGEYHSTMDTFLKSFL